MSRVSKKPWYEDYFGPDYLLIDIQEHTAREVEFLCEVLNLGRRTRLLDAGCGYGRHLLPLAGRGIPVVGCDLSEYMLRELKRRFRKAVGETDKHERNNLKAWMTGGPRLVRCDTRALPFRHEFDCIINMFNSFGYFKEERDNYTMLASIAEALKPGGLFLIDLVNRDFVLRFNTRKEWFEHGDAVILENKWFDPVLNRSEIDVTVIDKHRKRSYHHSIRLYSYTELAMLLEAAGFRIKAVFGGFNGEQFDINHDRMLILAQTLEGEAA
ncbi:methyltransferase domain-containing protein [bacterium]|nr:methyltransferase domain-containing protein [bacterium]